MIEAYFLPQTQIPKRRQGIRTPQGFFLELSPTQISEIADQLITAQKKLSDISIFMIVDAIAQTSAQWRDAQHPIRKKAEALLPEACGLSKEMIPLILNDIFEQLTKEKLLEFLEAELGDAAILDHFCEQNIGQIQKRAFGPSLIAHILPGNILGASIISLICGLLVKSANLLRVSQEEILFTRLFVESLKDLSPEMTEAIAVLRWDKQNTEITQIVFQKADFIIAYGNDESIAAVHALIPANTPRLFHGNKLSLGLIAREQISQNLAKKVAMDVARYDQCGCLSPHLYYVESGGSSSPLDFARQVAEALRELATILPQGEKNKGAASQIQQLRGTLPLKGGLVFESADSVDWTVLYDPSPVFSFSPLGRCIWIKPVSELKEIPRMLAPLRHVLQAIGIAIPKTRANKLVETFSKMGGCRICPIGEMQRPPLNWSHDGQKRLLPLIRFVDWEKK